MFIINKIHILVLNKMEKYATICVVSFPISIKVGDINEK